MDDLYNILRTYRTTPRVPTEETPFKLTFGMQAVIHLDIGLPTSRTEDFNQEENDTRLRANLDLLNEVREQAPVCMAAYQYKVVKYYNSQVKTKIFKIGDLVLRMAEASQPIVTTKLSPKWEGPYQVIKIVRPRTYQLQWLDHSLVPQT